MKKTLAIALAILTTACADNQNLITDFTDYGTTDSKEIQKIDPSIGYSALAKAPEHSNSLSELNYQQISESGKVEFNITDKNQAFTFTTGKSFVKGFALPQIDGDIKITLSTPIINSVFVPTVLILDKQYKPTQVYGEETFMFNKASVLNVARIFGKIELSEAQTKNNQAKYLLVFTTEKAMQSTTTLADPTPSSVELGRADAVYKIHTNKPLPHTATGAIKLVFDYKESNLNSAQEMVTETAPHNTIVKPSTATIQPETEAMFIKLIEIAIKNGDLDKAKHFVEEAQRAGSNKANDALLDAQKKYNK